MKGHQVVTAESGSEAVRFCQDRSFDLVITDLVMPDRDGLELIRSLQQSHSNLPILAMSGAGNGLLKLAIARAAAEALAKPFTPGDLLTIVDKILRKRSG